MVDAGSRRVLLVGNVSRLEGRILCPEGSRWIWQLLEQCVQNPWEYCSVVMGLMSIVCFLFAALPQLYVAYKNGKVDQALSVGFLLCWLGGDFTNFVGCYLTNQLPIQTVTAIFYCNMDIIMISQFAYYKLKNNKMQVLGTGVLKAFCISWVIVCITLSVIMPSQIFLRNKNRFADMEINKESLGITEMSGFICGYVSSVFYLASRFPQLYKNFQRKSTEGTSYMLFALAMLGNFTYGLSLAIKLPAISHGKNQYVVHHLPWFIGSFGVLILDFFMTAQFILYRKHKISASNLLALEVEPLLVDEEET
ncbi:lysosomal amino acid transporter 1 homolog [Spea bombifrons]|uniref:lysosomal amino acid transporter 1 homolog n=1 Tax=Spea bombifrons TaxID=233779 RepID=UPI00234A484B|nr:lysosomal amino acid transporter 1 homolog [Spea bombifrons]